MGLHTKDLIKAMREKKMKENNKSHFWTAGPDIYGPQPETKKCSVDHSEYYEGNIASQKHGYYNKTEKVYCPECKLLLGGGLK
jgi:hypothetical protein